MQTKSKYNKTGLWAIQNTKFQAVKSRNEQAMELRKNGSGSKLLAAGQTWDKMGHFVIDFH